jgi:hypothetical protein
MDTPLVPQSDRSASTYQPSTLKGALEKLDIVPFTPESVAEYKADKIEQMAASSATVRERRLVGMTSILGNTLSSIACEIRSGGKHT